MATKTAETRPEATTASATSPTLVSDAAGTQVTPGNVTGLAVDMIGMATRLAGDEDPVAAAQADVTDELEKGGPAFGSFLRSVGMAVAETQAALDKGLAETAKMLSSTTLEIPAAFVQELDDQGQVKEQEKDSEGNLPGALMQKLPLIAIMPPTAYAFRQVHLTADMDVSEFNTANGFNIKKNHVGWDLNAEASYGLFGGFNASADTQLKTTFDNDSERRFTSEDKAAGKLHMEATLEPRHDITIPKPVLIQKGPKLRLNVVKREEFDAAGVKATDPKLVAKRVVTINAKLVKQNGDPLVGDLDVTCDAGFVCDTGAGTTASDGTLEIKVERTGLTPESNNPVSTVVRGRMKLVTAEVVINL